MVVVATSHPTASSVRTSTSASRSESAAIKMANPRMAGRFWTEGRTTGVTRPPSIYSTKAMFKVVYQTMEETQATFLRLLADFIRSLPGCDRSAIIFSRNCSRSEGWFDFTSPSPLPAQRVGKRKLVTQSAVREDCRIQRGKPHPDTSLRQYERVEGKTQHNNS